ncbi:hypothetical protein CNEO2_1650003 [Clostridium neonatale]|nr:hypothetical protein CNEO2_1650003 [Clostridium neonatale]CAI3566591.1 hypothetical protein CNEO4_1150018 [Clostridium neonatale]CAI3723777.1 hypothetical protein CNEO2_800085 [Clostridium neonatale]CAI3732819.1 hypothetical protein CNEO2_90001 [Clostridium neonatale]DAQ89303.1 MAG TPA: hypothetical protein [Caudoviricetes sp.]
MYKRKIFHIKTNNDIITLYSAKMGAVVVRFPPWAIKNNSLRGWY